MSECDDGQSEQFSVRYLLLPVQGCRSGEFQRNLKHWKSTVRKKELHFIKFFFYEINWIWKWIWVNTVIQVLKLSARRLALLKNAYTYTHTYFGTYRQNGCRIVTSTFKANMDTKYCTIHIVSYASQPRTKYEYIHILRY